jgi:hypothetical protein
VIAALTALAASALAPLADRAADVPAGAVLTLVLPLALLVVVVAWWYFTLRRGRER